MLEARSCTVVHQYQRSKQHSQYSLVKVGRYAVKPSFLLRGEGGNPSTSHHSPVASIFVSLCYARFQEGTRSAKDKLERYCQERSARNGTYLGRGGGGSSQQTRMASECGPIRSRGRGMNQVKSSQCYAYSTTADYLTYRPMRRES